MKDRLYEAFDQVHADQEQKRSAQRAVAQAAARRKERTRHTLRLAPALACLLLLVGWGGYQLCMTPTSVVSIDINPSVELAVNRFDRVVSLEGYNPDGAELARSLEVRFLDCAQAVEQVLASPGVTDCLEQGGLLSIAVAGEDREQNERLRQQIETATGGQYPTQCYFADAREREQVRETGLSYGKYRAWLELQSLDPNAELEQVRNMTMRQLRERITELQIEQGLAANTGELWRPGKGLGYGKQGKSAQPGT